MRAAENAANSHILEPTDVDRDTHSPLLVANPAVTATNKSDNVTLLPSILPLHTTSGHDSAAARPSVQHDEAGIDLHANLVHYRKTRDRKSTCMSFCRDKPAKALRPESRGARGQDARRWNQGQENLIDKSCLDCKIHFTVILEKCADADVLYKPRTKH